MPVPTRYSGFSDPRRWSILAALAEQAERHPDGVWYQGVDGSTLTFAQALGDARRVASLLADLGVRPGDAVAILHPGTADFVRAWLGVGWLGAVAVLLNTELRGAFLSHQLRNCGARAVIVDPELLPAVAAVRHETPELERIVATGHAPTDAHAFAAWRTQPEHAGTLPRPEDVACIMYTSGTSGPAKGVLMPHAHCTLYGVGAVQAFDLGASDRYYICLPLYHVNGLLMQFAAALLAGIPALVRPRFSASAWLADVRGFGATVTNTLGALAAFVLAQPPSGIDRDHALRAMCNAPNVPEHEALFRERFGVRDVFSGFGMTEVNIPVWGRLGCSRPGAAGFVHREHFEVIVADPETDREMPTGELGEILVRPKVPFGFMAGYHGMPDKTVEAWRNLWFHTGDAGVFAADGALTFVDRLKDCIRRRGENISATEVEAAILTLGGVAEVAAIAVPSGIAGGEDEVMLCVVAAPGAGLTPEQVAAHADVVLPRFARPRFIDIAAELPKTGTGKVQRAALRRRDLAGVWQRTI